MHKMHVRAYLAGNLAPLWWHSQTVGVPRRKVLLIGWDGVRDDVLRRLQPPALSSLAASGHWWTTTLPDVTVAPTVTAVGWATVLTGVWPDQHQVSGNECEHHLLHRFPDLLTRAFCADPKLKTYGAASALIFGSNHGPGPLLGPGTTSLTWLDRTAYAHGFYDTDPLIAADAVEHLQSADPDVAFVYFGETDKAAHSYGVGPEYTQAILRQDSRLHDLIGAIRSRQTFDDEDWLVMVTTDHGHLDEGGHGGGSWQERQAFLVAGTPEARSAQVWNDDARPIDIAPTAWAHLGVQPSTRWACQGRVLFTQESQPPDENGTGNDTR